MAQWFFPMRSVNHDRTYNDSDFTRFYNNLFRTGVIMPVADALQVKPAPNSGMSVVVSTGAAIIKGYQFHNTEMENLDIAVASATQNRIDSVVVRLDQSARRVSLAVKAGNISVQRTDAVYEIQLATISVPRNAFGITSANITDSRAKETVCGYSSPFEKVHVSGLEAQYADLLNQTYEGFKAQSGQELSVMQSTWQTWFSNLQNQLDTNQAGNLQNQINAIQADYVPKGEVATTAGANKILKLNASGKLPASITGDADTLDGNHASAFATAKQGAKADAALPRSGGTMVGSIAMGANKVTGLAMPTANGDAVNKSYVDLADAGKTDLVLYNRLAGIGGALPSGTNLNNVNDTGVYLLNGSYSYTNAPVTWGLLIVQSVQGGFRSQMAIQQDTVLFRMFANGSYDSWKSPKPLTASASIALLNNWTPSTQYGAPKAKLIAGIVHLSGQAYNGNNYRVGTIPDGYRPVNEDLLVSGAAVSSEGVVQPVTLKILRTGEIAAVTNLNVSLLYRINFSGISYPII